MESRLPTNDFIYFDRIRNHSPSAINERIDLLTRARVDHVANQGRQAMERRIADLDREWDIDRALMLNFAVVGGMTFTAGISGKKGWLYFFAIQMFFLGWHAAQGWCPPASVMRRLNFRTRLEIDAEKNALLARLGRSSRDRPELPDYTEAA